MKRKTKIIIITVTIIILLAGGLYYYSFSSMPSIVFIGISWSPEHIVEKAPVSFNLTIQNRYFFSRKVNIKVYLTKFSWDGEGDEIEIGKKPINLPPSSVSSVQYSLIFNRTGFYRVKFLISSNIYLKQLIWVSPSNKKIKYFRFAVFGDNRPANSMFPQPEPFKELIKEVNIIHPNFSVLIGDIIYGYHCDMGRIKLQWTEFLKVYHSSIIPIFVAPGNHEVQTESSPNSGNPDAQALYIMNLGKPYYSFTVGNSYFIILDTDIVGEADEITGKQLEWLRNELNKADSYKHVFIFMHRPIVSYPGADMLNDNNEILNLLLKHRVEIVFQAHNHVFYYEMINGTKFYVTGGAGAPLYASSERGGVYHFLLITVNGSQVNVQFIPTGSLKFQRISNDEVKLEYTFKNPITFSWGDYSIALKPRPLLLQGIEFNKINGNITVIGGREIFSNSKILVSTVIKPGESKDIKLSYNH